MICLLFHSMCVLEEQYFVLSWLKKQEAKQAKQAKQEASSKAKQTKKNKYGHQVCTRFRSYDEGDEARSRLEPT